MHEKSFTPGEYTQAVIEIKGDAPFHNSLEIETGEQNFIEWVSVEASDDARKWRIVQERAPIFRFAKDGREGTRVVHYSENNARYLRVRIFDGDKQFPVLGAVVFHETVGPEERVPIDASEITPIRARRTKDRSVWSADLGGTGPPVSEVRFDVAPMEFVRSAWMVAASDDGKDWRTLAGGQIYRFHQRRQGAGTTRGSGAIRRRRRPVLAHHGGKWKRCAAGRCVGSTLHHTAASGFRAAAG